MSSRMRMNRFKSRQPSSGLFGLSRDVSDTPVGRFVRVYFLGQDYAIPLEAEDKWKQDMDSVETAYGESYESFEIITDTVSKRWVEYLVPVSARLEFDKPTVNGKEIK